MIIKALCTEMSYRLTRIWVASWKNQQNDLCAQQRLRSDWASAQFDQSSLSAWGNLGSLATHRAHGEDSDQTGRMPRLIRAFRWAHMPFCLFLNEAAHLVFSKTQSRDPMSKVGNSADPEQTANQSLHCLQYPLHLLDALLYGNAILFNFLGD